MAGNDPRTALVICPFFRNIRDNRAIVCEAPEGCNKLVLEFLTRDDMEKRLVKCCDRFEYEGCCEIAAMLADKYKDGPV